MRLRSGERSRISRENNKWVEMEVTLSSNSWILLIEVLLA